MSDIRLAFFILAALAALNAGIYAWWKMPINAGAAVFIGLLALELGLGHNA